MQFEKVPIRNIHNLHIDKAFSTNRKDFFNGISLNAMEGCSLNHFPDEVCQFKHLRKLSLYRHQIREIPEYVSNLTELKHLNLS